MHNQHTDLSQTLADQHLTELQEQATHQRRSSRRPAPRAGAPQLVPPLVAAAHPPALAGQLTNRPTSPIDRSEAPMSTSRLAQALVLGALLAATTLAGHDRRRPRPGHRCAHRQAGRPAATHPNPGRGGLAPAPATTNQSTIAGDTQRPPTEGQVGEPWHPRLHAADSSSQAERPTQLAGRVAGRADRRAGAGRRCSAARRASRQARPRLTA